MSDTIDVRRDEARSTARRPGRARPDDSLIDLTVDGTNTAAHRSQAGTKVTPPPVRDSSYYLG